MEFYTMIKNIDLYSDMGCGISSYHTPTLEEILKLKDKLIEEDEVEFFEECEVEVDFEECYSFQEFDYIYRLRDTESCVGYITYYIKKVVL